MRRSFSRYQPQATALAKKYLPHLVLVILAVAIGLTRYHAIYPDEVAYKIFLERYLISGGFKQSVLPYCSSGFLASVPMLLKPAAIFWTVISKLGNTWISYRLLPALSLILVYAVLIWHNRRHGNRTFWPLLLFVTLGPALYGLLILRPEVSIIAIALSMFFLGIQMAKESRALRLSLYAIALLLIYSIAAYLHPKALYLIVVAFASILFGSLNLRHRVRQGLFAFVFLAGAIGITYSAFQLHETQFMTCDSAPFIQGRMARQSVNVFDLYKNPALFVEQMHMAFNPSVIEIIFKRMKFEKDYQIGYLPNKLTKAHVDKLANLGIVIAVILFLLYAVAKAIYCLLRLKGKPERREFYLLCSVMAALFAPFMFNITRNFYEISFFSGVLMACVTLLWPLGNPPFRHKQRAIALMSFALIGFSLFNVMLAYHNYTVALRNGYEGPGVSYKTRRKALTNEIRTALEQAYIGPDEPLIIDDLTYDSVSDHPITVPITYLYMLREIPAAERPPHLMQTALAHFHVRYGVTQCVFFDGEFKGMLPNTILATLPVTKFRVKETLVPATLCVFKVNE